MLKKFRMEEDSNAIEVFKSLAKENLFAKKKLQVENIKY